MAKPKSSGGSPLKWWTGGLGALAFIAAVVTAVAPPEWIAAPKIATAVLVLAGVIVALVKAIADEREKAALARQSKSLSEQLDEERLRTRATLTGRLAGAAQLIEGMAAEGQTKRHTDLGKLQHAMVTYAAGLTSTENARASYFRLTDRTPASRKMTHLLSEVTGTRTDPGTQEFVEGSGVNQGVWALLDQGSAVLVLDIDKDGPADFEKGTGKAYRTFISAGVRADDVPMGLLTVNAEQPGQLDGTDVAMVRVLAHLLGAAEALGEGTMGLNALRGS